MPPVTIRNDASSTLNVARTLGAPLAWRNSLQPGESWTHESAPWSYTFEIRRDLGDVSQFSLEDSLDAAGTIGTAVAAGVASVATGALGALGTLYQLLSALCIEILTGGDRLGTLWGWPAAAPKAAFGAAGSLMHAAHLHGEKWGEEAPGFVHRAHWVGIGFEPKTFVIREIGGAFRFEESG
ncbi:hypothetical protein PUNSTDRAFT_131704 [Punctularia strigosozonata HHB-11173 SS5]|uniref:uncharacterized protein n=1 Tax=Punctularia strigosozonata (strain HHB-11173) TaxID=741275 RepID=UPI0004416ED5|nr:uncharacterized protein PUNSTDRAFT_131704 [Punctularia strigosozonata HHB-11173 SS5]EIN11542.1 hypothetical protein PUNSTDRAFT_131704 [Punctularia strigosozonata HHB-11173 SS5]